MIVLTCPYGNHSNRLFQMIHFEAFCKETKQKFVSICFQDMAELYGKKDSKLKNAFFTFLHKGLRKVRLIKDIDFGDEQSNETLAKQLKKFRISFVSGWYFRRHELTEKYRKYFQSKYVLASKYTKKNDFVKKVLTRKENEVVAGIHIRRGDYKEWQGGKYYFEDEVYAKAMKRFEEVMKKNNKTVKFVLFSNEPLSFTESDVLFVSHEKWYIDQYIMSECDYLIGPMSTFTGWASYIGEVPLLYLQDKDMEIKLEDFQIING